MLGTIMAANVLFVIIPAPLGARPREAGRPRARSAARDRRQAAVGAQQLPDAACSLHDARRPLPVHVHARPRLGRARRADGRRRRDPPLLQPASRGGDALVDPGRLRAARSRRSRSGSGRGDRPGARAATAVPFAQARPIVQARCPRATRCTRRSPGSPRRRPDVVLDTPEQIHALASRSRVRGGLAFMPLGNATKMTTRSESRSGSGSQRGEGRAVIEITAAGFGFVARLEEERSPRRSRSSGDAPVETKLIHAGGAASRPGSRWATSSSATSAGECDELPGAGRAVALSGRGQRDRDALPLRRHLLREQGGPARGQPLRHGGRRHRASARSASSCSGKARRTSPLRGRP